MHWRLGFAIPALIFSSGQVHGIQTRMESQRKTSILCLKLGWEENTP